jgi:Neuraminidase (sialidase)
MPRRLLVILGLVSCVVTFAGEPLDLSRAPHATVVSGGGYFPVLIRLNNGTLMAVLRGGAPHIGIKGRLDIVTSQDGGKTWSAPRTVVDGPEDDRNPALGQLKNGDIVLAYAILHGYDSTGLKLSSDRTVRRADGVYVIRSSDNGKTWTRPERSESTFALEKKDGSLSPYGKIVQLEDGTALMSVYYQFPDQRGHQDYVFRSHDNGKTWGEPVLIGEHYNETGLLTLPGGRVLAALRSEHGGHLAIAASKDGGKTWSTPVEVTRDNEHPGDLILLRSGDILLTYGERNKPFGVETILSHDKGKTWDIASKTVLAGDAASTDCGYPSSVQLPNGSIVTVYYQVDDPHNAPASAKAKSIVWRVPQKNR